jgi:two-component system response regulator EvgA
LNGTKARKARKGLQVLIADDSSHVRQSLTRLLVSIPRLEVVGEATNGFQALDGVRKHNPDVLILDISMPLMNGLEVLAALKQEGANCRVFVFSGHADAEYRDKCRNLGAACFFEKTRQLDELLEALKRAASVKSLRNVR